MPTLSLLDLNGKDAEAILHNLTTNEIKSLQVGGKGTESFITNVKGKCLGHVLVFRTANGFRLIGAGGSGSGDSPSPSQSQAIAEHADRYTIREDAVPSVLDTGYHGWLLIDVLTESSELGYRTVFCGEVPSGEIPSGGIELQCYDVPWVRSGEDRNATLVLCPAEVNLDAERLLKILSSSDMLDVKGQASVLLGDEAVVAFHAHRIATGFPWYGIDVDQSHLPQEVGREPQTISFTKGCYLGQETVARLDALGQVQKMLVAWSIDLPADAELPAVDTKLFAGGEKPVGRLTSIGVIVDDSTGKNDDKNDSPKPIRALGYARRTHFEPGSTASGMSGDLEFNATVVASSSSK